MRGSGALERSRGRCRYCGAPADQVDHIKPRARGGTNHPSNLVACCWLCNRRKGNQLLNGGWARVWRFGPFTTGPQIPPRAQNPAHDRPRGSGDPPRPPPLTAGAAAGAPGGDRRRVGAGERLAHGRRSASGTSRRDEVRAAVRDGDGRCGREVPRRPHGINAATVELEVLVHLDVAVWCRPCQISLTWTFQLASGR